MTRGERVRAWTGNGMTEKVVDYSDLPSPGDWVEHFENAVAILIPQHTRGGQE